jgi:DnaK suppressor protein
MIAEQARAEAQAVALTREFDEIVASAQLSNADDEHDPEGSTIAYERQKTAALLERAHAKAAELDRAMAALDDGSYGNCTRCGRDIAFERLLTIPSSSTCIACAS